MSVTHPPMYYNNNNNNCVSVAAAKKTDDVLAHPNAASIANATSPPPPPVVAPIMSRFDVHEQSFVPVPCNCRAISTTTDRTTVPITREVFASGRPLDMEIGGKVTIENECTTLLNTSDDSPVSLTDSVTRTCPKGRSGSPIDSIGWSVKSPICGVSFSNDAGSMNSNINGRDDIERSIPPRRNDRIKIIESIPASATRGYVTLQQVWVVGVNGDKRLAVIAQIEEEEGLVTLVNHNGEVISAKEAETFCVTPDGTYFSIGDNQLLCKSDNIIARCRPGFSTELTIQQASVIAIDTRVLHQISEYSNCSAVVNCETGKVVIQNNENGQHISADVCLTISVPSSGNGKGRIPILVGPDHYIIGRPLVMSACRQLFHLSAVVRKSNSFAAVLVASVFPDIRPFYDLSQADRPRSLLPRSHCISGCFFAILTATKCWIIDFFGRPVSTATFPLTVITTDGQAAYIGADGTLSGKELGCGVDGFTNYLLSSKGSRLKNCHVVVFDNESNSNSVDCVEAMVNLETGEVEFTGSSDARLSGYSLALVTTPERLHLRIGPDGCLSRPVIIPTTGDNVYSLGGSCYCPLSARSDGHSSVVNGAVVLLPSNEILIDVAITVESTGQVMLLQPKGGYQLLPNKSFVLNPFATFATVTINGKVSGDCIDIATDRRSATLSNANIALFCPRGDQRLVRGVNILIGSNGSVIASRREIGLELKGVGVVTGVDGTKLILGGKGSVIGKTIIMKRGGRVLVMGSDKNRVEKETMPLLPPTAAVVNRHDTIKESENVSFIRHNIDDISNQVDNTVNTRIGVEAKSKTISPTFPTTSFTQTLLAGIASSSINGKTKTHFGSSMVVTSDGFGFIFQADGELLPPGDSDIAVFSDGTAIALKSKSHKLTGKEILLSNSNSVVVKGCTCSILSSEGHISIYRNTTLTISERCHSEIWTESNSIIRPCLLASAVDAEGTAITINSSGHVEGRALIVGPDDNVLVMGQERAAYSSFVNSKLERAQFSSAIINAPPNGKGQPRLTILGATAVITYSSVRAMSPAGTVLNLLPGASISTSDGILLTMTSGTNCLGPVGGQWIERTRTGFGSVCLKNATVQHYALLSDNTGSSTIDEDVTVVVDLGGRATLSGKLLSLSVITTSTGCRIRVGFDGFVAGSTLVTDGSTLRYIGPPSHYATTITGEDTRASTLHGCTVISDRHVCHGATTSVSSKGEVAVFKVDGSVSVLNSEAVIIAADGTKAQVGPDGLLCGASFIVQDDGSVLTACTSGSIFSADDISSSTHHPATCQFSGGQAEFHGGTVWLTDKNAMPVNMKGMLALIRPLDGPTFICRPDNRLVGQILIKPANGPVTLLRHNRTFPMTTVDSAGEQRTCFTGGLFVRAIDSQGVQQQGTMTITTDQKITTAMMNNESEGLASNELDRSRSDVDRVASVGEGGVWWLTTGNGCLFVIGTDGHLKARSLPGLPFSKNPTLPCEHFMTGQIANLKTDVKKDAANNVPSSCSATPLYVPTSSAMLPSGVPHIVHSDVGSYQPRAVDTSAVHLTICSPVRQRRRLIASSPRPADRHLSQEAKVNDAEGEDPNVTRGWKMPIIVTGQDAEKAEQLTALRHTSLHMPSNSPSRLLTSPVADPKRVVSNVPRSSSTTDLTRSVTPDRRSLTPDRIQQTWTPARPIVVSREVLPILPRPLSSHIRQEQRSHKQIIATRQETATPRRERQLTWTAQRGDNNCSTVSAAPPPILNQQQFTGAAYDQRKDAVTAQQQNIGICYAPAISAPLPLPVRTSAMVHNGGFGRLRELSRPLHTGPVVMAENIQLQQNDFRQTNISSSFYYGSWSTMEHVI